MLDSERFHRLNEVIGHLHHLDEADLFWIVQRIREVEVPLAWERATAAEVAMEDEFAVGVL